MVLQQIIQYLTGSLGRWNPFPLHPFSRFLNELLVMIAAECDDLETILALRFCGSGPLSEGAAEALFSTIKKQPSQEAVQDLIALGNHHYSRHVKTLSLSSGIRGQSLDPSAYHVNGENLLAKAVLKFENLGSLELHTDTFMTETMQRAGARDFMNTLTKAAATSTSRVPKKRLLIKARGHATLDFRDYFLSCFHLDADADLTTRFSEISLDVSKVCPCYGEWPVLLNNFFVITHDKLEKLDIHTSESSNAWFSLPDDQSGLSTWYLPPNSQYASQPSSHSFPALRELKLSNVVCNVEGLMRFIGKGHETLRELTLENIDVRSIRPVGRAHKGLATLLDDLRNNHKLSRFHYKNLMYTEERVHGYMGLENSIDECHPRIHFQRHMNFQLVGKKQEFHDAKLLTYGGEEDDYALGKMLLAVQDQGQELLDDTERYYARMAFERDAKAAAASSQSEEQRATGMPRRRNREERKRAHKLLFEQYKNYKEWA